MKFFFVFTTFCISLQSSFRTWINTSGCPHKKRGVDLGFNFWVCFCLDKREEWKKIELNLFIRSVYYVICTFCVHPFSTNKEGKWVEYLPYHHLREINGRMAGSSSTSRKKKLKGKTHFGNGIWAHKKVRVVRKEKARQDFFRNTKKVVAEVVIMTVLSTTVGSLYSGANKDQRVKWIVCGEECVQDKKTDQHFFWKGRSDFWKWPRVCDWCVFIKCLIIELSRNKWMRRFQKRFFSGGILFFYLPLVLMFSRLDMVNACECGSESWYVPSDTSEDESTSDSISLRTMAWWCWDKCAEPDRLFGRLLLVTRCGWWLFLIFPDEDFLFPVWELECDDGEKWWWGLLSGSQ